MRTERESFSREPDPSGRTERNGQASVPAGETGRPQGILRGLVLSREDERLRLAVDGETVLEARRAAGCLLRPQPGDEVLFHAQADGATYVLSVLERAGGPAVLDAGQDARLEARGRLELAGDQVTARAGRELRLTGERGRFEFEGLGLLAGVLTAKAGRIAAVAASLDGVVGDLSQKITTAVREVETEVVKAGGLRQFVRERFLVRAGRAAILAEEDVTVDGEKINLG